MREAGVPLTIVRPSAVYGPGDRAFLTLFRLAARGFFPLLGDGRQELSLVFAADLARGLVAAATSRATLGRDLSRGPRRGRDATPARRDAGSGARPSCPLPAVARAGAAGAAPAARATGRPGLPAPDKAHELLAPAWRASSEALRRDAGWVAEVPLERGFAETAQALPERRLALRRPDRSRDARLPGHRARVHPDPRSAPAAGGPAAARRLALVALVPRASSPRGRGGPERSVASWPSSTRSPWLGFYTHVGLVNPAAACRTTTSCRAGSRRSSAQPSLDWIRAFPSPALERPDARGVSVVLRRSWPGRPSACGPPRGGAPRARATLPR